MTSEPFHRLRRDLFDVPPELTPKAPQEVMHEELEILPSLAEWRQVDLVPADPVMARGGSSVEDVDCMQTNCEAL